MYSPEVNALPEKEDRFADRSAISVLSPILLSRTLVAIALIAQVVVAWYFWTLTWDDSAITLGFARTFALTGRIEPTPGSGVVEGYSTTLWMLLMAAVAKFVTTPSTLLAVAKISTLLLNLANILLIRRWLLTWTPETLANLVAGSVGCGLMFYETINGMETPLMLTLILAMLLLKSVPGNGAYICFLLAGSAFLLVRWETAWLLVPFVLVERPVRRAIFSSATWLFVFISSNLIRWHYFGSILPNTIIAKRNFPYSKPFLSFSQQVLRHLREPAFILGACKVMLIILAASLVYRFFKEPTSLRKHFFEALHNSWELRFSLLFVLFSLILTTAIGPNAGPPVRSFYCGWPFLFCLLLLPIMTNTRSLPWFTAVLCLFAVLRLFARVEELNTKEAPAYMPGATVDKVALMNRLLSEVEATSHHQDLLYAGPDMGAVMLYSKGIRVIDLGLLCDPVLAHQGYTAIDSYVLHQRHPDVIEVHQDWTTLSNLQASPLFLSEYRPVYIHGIRVFLTRKLIADIDPSHLTERSFSPTGHPDDADLPHQEYIHYETNDYILNHDLNTYLTLN